MSQLFEVDQFTSEQYHRELVARWSAINEAIGVLGLQGADESEGPALIFGGSALTMQVVDTHIPDGHIPDLDIIVSQSMFRRLGEQFGFWGTPIRLKNDAIMAKLKEKSLPLPVDVLTGDSPTAFKTFIGEEPYTGELNDSIVEYNGVHVVWAGVAAKQKVRKVSARVKDLAGVVKGHVVATHGNHPIVEDELWQDAVGQAVDRLVEDRIQVPLWRRVTRKGPDYPSWVRQLIDTDFAHPAFADIPRET